MDLIYNKGVFDKNNIDIVEYHSGCKDGFGGAFVIWLYYKQRNLLETKLDNSLNTVSIKFIKGIHKRHDNGYSDLFYDKYKDKNVVFVDFCHPYDVMLKIVSYAKSVLILDHHISAMNDMKKIFSSKSNISNLEMMFDMQYSGCVLAWNYIFGDLDKCPKFLLYIQADDIYKGITPDIKAFITCFSEKLFTFELYENMLNDDVFNECIKTGYEWLKYKDIIINRSSKKFVLVPHLINNEYATVAYINTNEFVSEVADKIFSLEENYNSHICGYIDFVCVWFYNQKKKFTKFFLRSRDNRMDVQKIAIAHNGGGHHNSASMTLDGLNCILPYEVLSDKYINLLSDVQIQNNILLIDCDKTLGQKFWRNPDINFINMIFRNKQNCIIALHMKKKLSGIHEVNAYHIILNINKFKEIEAQLKSKVKLDSITQINSYTRVKFNILRSDDSELFFNNIFNYEI